MNDFPETLDVDSLIGPTRVGLRREVRAIAVATINGSATEAGSTGAMGNDTDAALLQGLREWSDAILVGAETVRTENYGPVVLDGAIRRARTRAGSPEVPRLVIVSRSLEFPAHLPALNKFDPEYPPLILTPQSSIDDPAYAKRRKVLMAAGVELASSGDGSVDGFYNALDSRNLRRITCEGGPGIYAMLWEADWIDVLHLTIEPNVAAPVEKELFSVRLDGTGFAQELQLEDVQATSDGRVFLRYRRFRPENLRKDSTTYPAT